MINMPLLEGTGHGRRGSPGPHSIPDPGPVVWAFLAHLSSAVLVALSCVSWECVPRAVPATSTSNICWAGAVPQVCGELLCSCSFVPVAVLPQLGRRPHCTVGVRAGPLATLSPGEYTGKARGPSKARTPSAFPAYRVWLLPSQCSGILMWKAAPPNCFPR